MRMDGQELGRDEEGSTRLVQMSAGIADYGMRQAQAEKPRPLPVQALDHATGYLMAAAAIRGIALRIKQGNGTEARLSLARTAKFLVDHPADDAEEPFAPENESDRSPDIEVTDWGRAQRILPPVQIAGAPMLWDCPARKLGSAAPRWRDD
jgi:crotonobetainyl-CoA:carnitine CoA-transferase CaiB-like acyl-CoA transferase